MYINCFSKKKKKKVTLIKKILLFPKKDENMKVGPTPGHVVLYLEIRQCLTCILFNSIIIPLYLSPAFSRIKRVFFLFISPDIILNFLKID